MVSPLKASLVLLCRAAVACTGKRTARCTLAGSMVIVCLVLSTVAEKLQARLDEAPDRDLADTGTLPAKNAGFQNEGTPRLSTPHAGKLHQL